jgi:hypothetical protein
MIIANGTTRIAPLPAFLIGMEDTAAAYAGL